MAVQHLVAGPVELHVALGGRGSVAGFEPLTFLGYGERGVRLSFHTKFDPIRTDWKDLSPADMMFGGSEAFVSVDLKYFDPVVLAAIMQRGRGTPAPVQDVQANAPGIIPVNNAPTTGILGVPRGRELPGWRGGLMLAEGAATRLLVYPPYGARKPTQVNTTPWNFYAATLIGPEDWDPFGSAVTRVRLLWHCLSLTMDDGSEILYDTNVLGVLAPPIQVAAPPAQQNLQLAAPPGGQQVLQQGAPPANLQFIPQSFQLVQQLGVAIPATPIPPAFGNLLLQQQIIGNLKANNVLD